MESDYPVSERIFILKGGETLGPFEIEEILEGLDAGELAYDDVCLREGAGETERLREILDWEESPAPPPSDLDEDEFEEVDEEIPEPVAPRPSRVPLYHGHRSVVSFPLAFLGLVGGVVGAVWFYPAGPAFPLSGLLLSIFSLGYLSLMRYTCEYFITPRRVELVTGLIARSSKEIRISDIRAVNISCTGLVGILGVGTVDFITSGDKPEVSFTQVWAAKEVKSLVRKLQDSATP